MKPFLRWAGSKRRLLPRLEKYWQPDFERYVEPFMGSACFFLSVEPKKALLGDTNPNLVKTFKAVKNNPNRVYELLQELPQNKETYYQVRSDLKTARSSLDVASKFIYLNRFCFNGIYRTNTKGEFNVPYGGIASGSLPTLDHLIEVSRLLKRAEIVKTDFIDVLDQTVEGDFVYLDPPYSVANRRVFKQYGPSVFGTRDLERLEAGLNSMDERGVKFVVSYAFCPEAIKTFSKWRQSRHLTTRNISGFSKHRRKSMEMLATNLDMPE